MKLSLKIMTVLFIFAVIGITGCSKNQFDTNENASIYSESLPNGTISQYNVSVEDVIKMLYDQNRIISVEMNYKDKNTGAIGTLYTYLTKGGKNQILKVDREPKNINKGIVHSVKMYMINGDPYNVETACDGPDSGCIGIGGFYIAWK